MSCSYTPGQQAELDRLERDVREHLAPKPKRLAHSLSVAKTAETLALAYEVDAFCARAAGLLHDWEKVESHEEVLRRSLALGIDMGVDLALVEPLLHGIVAAAELPERYPELPSCVWQAIDRHTTAAADMTPLDMVVFVADGIEPLRGSNPALDEVRGMVGESPLEDVFWRSFVSGISYVLETERYLFPGTVDIYNGYAQLRASAKKNQEKRA